MGNPSRPPRTPWTLWPYATLVLLLVAIVLISIPAIGQPLPQTIHTEAEVKPLPDPVLGGGAVETVLILVHVHCEAPSITLTPIEIEHRLEASSSQVTAALGASSHTLTTELQTCLAMDTSAKYEVEAFIAFPQSLPAFEEIEFRFYTMIADEEELAATWTQQAAFQGELVVDAFPETLWPRTSEQETIEALLINRANAPLTVHVELESAPEHGNVTFPETLLVAYTLDGVDLTQFEIEYERFEPGTDLFTLRFTPSPTADPGREMATTSLTFRAEDADFGMEAEESPAPTGLVVFAAAAFGLWRSVRHRQ